MSFPDSVLTGANKSSQPVNLQICFFLEKHCIISESTGDIHVFGCLQCYKALWVMSKCLEGAAQIMMDNVPFGEGGKPWNRNMFLNFQNIQYQILDQAQCVSTCLSILLPDVVCLLTCLFVDHSSIQLTYNDTSDVLASYFTNVATIIQQQVHLLYCLFCFVYFESYQVVLG